MELGFETIGNATLTVFDRNPVLVTDPWIAGDPYFGSWGMSHVIPEEQLASIRAAPFAWFSHGHPDHLISDSLERLGGTRVLLPAHVGDRIQRDLTAAGYTVEVMPVARWMQLSDRVRAMCLPDYNQDATLLVDVGGTLIVDANDSQARGWMSLVRRLTSRYPRSFLLKLTGYNDADMINFFDEAGQRIAPPPMVRKRSGVPIGPMVARMAENFGVTHIIPFSAMHRYQREDSVWANECTTPVEAHARGFESHQVTILPAFIRYDVESGNYSEIRPPEAESLVRPASDFGDDWSELLEKDEQQRATRYFQSFEHLKRHLDYVNLRVGGHDTAIPLAARSFRRGVTFEAPRHSLVQSIDYHVFDDMLIGNFMKTTLHGDWPSSRLYPDFAPYVTKYGDGGGARNEGELRAYFGEYRRRTGTFPYLRHRLQTRAADMVRSSFTVDSVLYRLARRAYWFLGQR